MSFVKTKDDVQIYYKDWGKGHPSSSAMVGRCRPMTGMMLFFINRGYRVIAHDLNRV